MVIKNMYKIKKEGRIRAFFDVEWPGKLAIHGMKLVQADDGELWSAPPSREYEHEGQKKWAPIVTIFDATLRNKITELARAEYIGPADSEPDIPF